MQIGRESHASLLAVVTQWLTDSHIDVARCNNPTLNLAEDLADVLFWDFQLSRLSWLENRLKAGELSLFGILAPPIFGVMAPLENA